MYKATFWFTWNRHKKKDIFLQEKKSRREEKRKEGRKERGGARTFLFYLVLPQGNYRKTVGESGQEARYKTRKKRKKGGRRTTDYRQWAVVGVSFKTIRF